MNGASEISMAHVAALPDVDAARLQRSVVGLLGFSRMRTPPRASSHDGSPNTVIALMRANTCAGFLRATWGATSRGYFSSA